MCTASAGDGRCECWAKSCTLVSGVWGECGTPEPRICTSNHCVGCAPCSVCAPQVKQVPEEDRKCGVNTCTRAMHPHIFICPECIPCSVLMCR